MPPDLPTTEPAGSPEGVPTAAGSPATPPAARVLRFALWIPGIVLALAPAFVPPADPARVGGADVVRVGIALAGLSLLFGLLLTTPPDAIRLPRWLSRVLICLGFGVLTLPRLTRMNPAIPGWPGLPQWTAWIGWGVVAAVMLGALWCLLLLVLRLARRRPVGSPWNAALILWWPTTLLSGATLPPGPLTALFASQIGAAAVAVVLWLSATRDPSSSPTGTRAAMYAALWAAAVGACAVGVAWALALA